MCVIISLFEGERGMKEIVLCDDCCPEVVLPLCEKYNVGIEIQGFHNPAKVKDYEEILKKYNELLPHNISKYLHAPFADLCLASAAEKIVEATKYYFDYAYKAAREVGAKRITVHHGYVPGTSYLPNWIKRAVKFWKEYLLDKEIAFDMENLLEWDEKPLGEIVDEVDDDRLGLNLDIGHAHCNSKISVVEWIKNLGNKIKYVHLHNNHGERDEHLGLMNGNMDVIAVLNALNEYAPDAVWALECRLEDMEESLIFLKENGFIN